MCPVSTTASSNHRSEPNREQIRRWRRYLAEERSEAEAYRRIARRRSGIDRQILIELAQAEKRHENHWLALLGDHAYPPPRNHLYSTALQKLATQIGSVFVLALMQRSEERGTYDDDIDATDQMAADEHLHSEVVRALAANSRARFSGKARALVFGINDGLVSNLALIAGIVGSGAPPGIVVLTGFTGLVSGALSMGAGEYISITSQRELLESTASDPQITHRLSNLDRAANELKLLFLAKGEDLETAELRAKEIMEQIDGSQTDGSQTDESQTTSPPEERALHHRVTSETGTAADTEIFSAGKTAVESAFDSDPGAAYEAVGSGIQAGGLSFLSFSIGALLPILPFLLGMSGWSGILVAAGLVAAALLITGGTMGVLSGKPPAIRALRQVAIGLGAGTVTYLLGEVAAGVWNF